jgi:hypothetical protein
MILKKRCTKRAPFHEYDSEFTQHYNNLNLQSFVLNVQKWVFDEENASAYEVALKAVHQRSTLHLNGRDK